MSSLLSSLSSFSSLSSIASSSDSESSESSQSSAHPILTIRYDGNLTSSAQSTPVKLSPRRRGRRAPGSITYSSASSSDADGGIEISFANFGADSSHSSGSSSDSFDSPLSTSMTSSSDDDSSDDSSGHHAARCTRPPNASPRAFLAAAARRSTKGPKASAAQLTTASQHSDSSSRSRTSARRRRRSCTPPAGVAPPESETSDDDDDDDTYVPPSAATVAWPAAAAAPPASLSQAAAIASTTTSSSSRRAALEAFAAAAATAPVDTLGDAADAVAATVEAATATHTARQAAGARAALPSSVVSAVHRVVREWRDGALPYPLQAAADAAFAATVMRADAAVELASGVVALTPRDAALVAHLHFLAPRDVAAVLSRPYPTNVVARAVRAARAGGRRPGAESTGRTALLSEAAFGLALLAHPLFAAAPTGRARAGLVARMCGWTGSDGAQLRDAMASPESGQVYGRQRAIAAAQATYPVACRDLALMQTEATAAAARSSAPPAKRARR